MRKIPTLFLRDPDDRRHVTNTVADGCQWVLDGDGVATRKFDGIAVLLGADGTLMVRRQVKAGKPYPDGFHASEIDEATGIAVGWEPAQQSGFFKFVEEAVGKWGADPAAGTYELVGPKINGNPERYDGHELIPHGCEDADHLFVMYGVPDRSFDSLRALLLESLGPAGWEGLVFWSEPGNLNAPMAKIKVRDFL